MASVTDGLRKRFTVVGRITSLRKALTCGGSGSHSTPNGDIWGKAVGRVPSWRSSSSAASTCTGSEDSEREEPAAAVSIRHLLATLTAQPWQAGRFDQVSRLQEAARNQGSVELMYDKGGFGKVAVKKMPNKWMQASAAAFAKVRGSELERPWYDLAVVKWLNAKRFPYVCALHGIFRDESLTYVVFDLATEGDLLSWCSGLTHRGAAREQAIRLVVQRLCSAVAWLHDLGVAHGDLSLENVLLTKCAGEEELKVKLIDFGMATTQRRIVNQVRGKASYQAPEIHLRRVPYDPFLTDIFAMGVTFFCLAAQDYPWMATAPGECPFWRLMSTAGLRVLLTTKKPRSGRPGECLSEELSPSFIELLDGMLSVKPEKRSTLGERAFSDAASKTSVWDMAWMNRCSLGSA